MAPGHPYVRAEVIYAIRHEMATTLDDVLARRTRLHIFDRPAALAAASGVAALMATELHWDPSEIDRQLANYQQLCAAEDSAARDKSLVPNTPYLAPLRRRCDLQPVHRWARRGSRGFTCRSRFHL